MYHASKYLVLVLHPQYDTSLNSSQDCVVLHRYKFQLLLAKESWPEVARRADILVVSVE